MDPIMQPLQAAKAAPDFTSLRQTMVDCQIRTFDVTDRALIARILEVPREKFVPAGLADLAYSDFALKVRAAKPGCEARRLLAPMVLARLIQEADVKPEDKVLDIGPCTGYSTAILAGLARDIVALDADPELQAMIRSNLASIGLASIPVFAGPLPDGVAEKAPFDLIFLNGVAESHLDHLFGQLREDARLITLSRSANDPDGRTCHAIRFEKVSGQISSRILFDASAPILSAFRREAHFVF
jgi:protein-L-isoaspartate(D-aspartate) O-methyltransferase